MNKLTQLAVRAIVCLFFYAMVNIAHGQISFDNYAGCPGSTGFGDGAANAGFLNWPQGMALGPDGSLYVADTLAVVIRKVSPDGSITVFAGCNWNKGSDDGTGPEARFLSPCAVAFDTSGNLFVVDTWNIRKITSSGVVTTLLDRDTLGGIGFSNAFGIAVDASGNLYVADTDSNAIYKLTQVDGQYWTKTPFASLTTPMGIALDALGNLYVAQGNIATISKVSPSGDVTLLAGTPGVWGSADGIGSQAQFGYSSAVSIDSNGNVYVADTSNKAIRKITSSGVVTTVIAGATAQFDGPRGILVDPNGGLFVADIYRHEIKKVSNAGVVSTFAGAGLARLDFASWVTLGTDGNTYISDTTNGTIRKVTSEGEVITIAGTPTLTGYGDGIGAAARFNNPAGIAWGGNGILYVADQNNSCIRKITTDGVVSTLAGHPQSSGYADGSGQSAQFNMPLGIAVDKTGNLYVADAGNNAIRKVTPQGLVTTLAGSSFGSADGMGKSAQFNNPQGITVDNDGNVYVADTGNFTIRKVTAAGVVTTLAGTVGVSGNVDGTGATAQFGMGWGFWNGAGGLAVDSNANLYVADTLNYSIRKVTPQGVVTTVAGGQGFTDLRPGIGTAARLTWPVGVAVDSDGNVFVSQYSCVYKGTALQVTRSASYLNGRVTISGMANPHGLPSTIWLEYGPTQAYGGISAATYIGNGTSFVSTSYILKGLAANRTYHYRLGFLDSEGTFYGLDRTFVLRTLQNNNAILESNFPEQPLP